MSILIPSVVGWNQIMAFSSSKGDTQKAGVGGNLRPIADAWLIIMFSD